MRLITLKFIQKLIFNSLRKFQTSSTLSNYGISRYACRNKAESLQITVKNSWLFCLFDSAGRFSLTPSAYIMKWKRSPGGRGWLFLIFSLTFRIYQLRVLPYVFFNWHIRLKVKSYWGTPTLLWAAEIISDPAQMRTHPQWV